MLCSMVSFFFLVLFSKFSNASGDSLASSACTSPLCVCNYGDRSIFCTRLPALEPTYSNDVYSIVHIQRGCLEFSIAKNMFKNLTKFICDNPGTLFRPSSSTKSPTTPMIFRFGMETVRLVQEKPPKSFASTTASINAPAGTKEALDYSTTTSTQKLDNQFSSTLPPTITTRKLPENPDYASFELGDAAKFSIVGSSCFMVALFLASILFIAYLRVMKKKKTRFAPEPLREIGNWNEPTHKLELPIPEPTAEPPFRNQHSLHSPWHHPPVLNCIRLQWIRKLHFKSYPRL